MAGGHAAGGSHGLAELIDRHGESLVADFERFYRPLPEVLTSGSSPRYILSLIKKLPLDSHFMAEARGGDQYNGWTVDRYLAALTLDAINTNTWVLSKVNGGKGKKPEPVYKPKPKQDKPQTNRFAAMARAAFAEAARKKG